MKHFLKNVLLFILVMASALVVLAFSHGYIKYKNAVAKLPIDEAVSEVRAKENYTEIAEISDTFIEAIVSVEDRRFYSHGGFDIIGTLRAIVTDIKERSLKEGGSTISQQLAKNLYFPLDNTLERKVAEIIMATVLESKYSKDEILELYFNSIYYGSGYYSIYDASMGYFGKAPLYMTDYEATLLAGVPNAPSAYSPKVNLSLSHKRQEKVLSAMVSEGLLSKEEMAEILKEQKMRSH